MEDESKKEIANDDKADDTRIKNFNTYFLNAFLPLFLLRPRAKEDLYSYIVLMHIWYRMNVLLAYFHQHIAGAEGALKNAPTKKTEFDKWMDLEINTEGIMEDLLSQTTNNGKSLFEDFEKYRVRVKERKNNTNINSNRKNNWN